MADLEIVTVWAVAAVFVIAAGGKLLTRPSMVDLVTAMLELILGALLIRGFQPVGVRLLALGVSGVYTLYAFTRPPDHQCTCFGERLPSTSRAGQITRNSLLTGFAAAALGLALMSTGRPGLVIVDLSFGFILGLAIVVAPWLGLWVAGRDATLSGAA